MVTVVATCSQHCASYLHPVISILEVAERRQLRLRGAPNAFPEVREPASGRDSQTQILNGCIIWAGLEDWATCLSSSVGHRPCAAFHCSVRTEPSPSEPLRSYS